MKQAFGKYQGAGNDFIVIDNRGGTFPAEDTALIARLCDRHFGIGADGLMLLEGSGLPRMVYFNSDGRQSTMCGNGGRCFALWLKQLDMLTDGKAVFQAIDGHHEAHFQDGIIALHMQDVTAPEALTDHTWFVNTGSPHRVILHAELDSLDIARAALPYRHDDHYTTIGGTNVNYIRELAVGMIQIRTFERGVEGETLACGTGAVAAALVHATRQAPHKLCAVTVETLGGTLHVHFHTEADGSYTQVWLHGPAAFIFSGEIEL